MAKYILNGQEFKSQAAVKDYTRNFLKGLMGSSVFEGGEGWAFLSDLIGRHPEYEQKKEVESKPLP